MGWTSINPSYFDVNYRGTIGFDTLPHIFIGYKLATVSNNVQEQERDFTLKMGEYVVYPAYFPDKSQNYPNLWQSNHVENESFSPPKLGFVPYGFFGARGQCSSKIPCREACCSGGFAVGMGRTCGTQRNLNWRNYFLNNWVRDSKQISEISATFWIWMSETRVNPQTGSNNNLYRLYSGNQQIHIPFSECWPTNACAASSGIHSPIFRRF